MLSGAVVIFIVFRRFIFLGDSAFESQRYCRNVRGNENLLLVFAFAVAAVLTRRWRDHLAVGTIALTAWQMLLGSLVLAVLAFFLSARPVEWTPYFWFVLAYGTLFGTVLGWALWFYVLKLLPAGIAGLSVMAIPAIGILSARLQLGEQPGPVESVGMLLIVASLAVLSWNALRIRAAARKTAKPSA